MEMHNNSITKLTMYNPRLRGNYKNIKKSLTKLTIKDYFKNRRQNMYYATLNNTLNNYRIHIMKKLKILIEVLMNGKNKQAKFLVAILIAFLTGNHSPELLEILLGE